MHAFCFAPGATSENFRTADGLAATGAACLMKKFLLTLASFALALSSCAPEPQTRSVGHVYQDQSRIAFISIFDMAGGPQVTVTSLGGVKGDAKRPIPKAEFDSIWNRLHAEDLSRFEVKDRSESFNTMDNYVVTMGYLPVSSMKTYVVPKGSASSGLKATVEKIRKLNPL